MKQIESMDAQIKNDKEFINNQLIEREQEREEFESKLSDMNNFISKKSNQMIENHDALQQRVSSFLFSLTTTTNKLKKT